MRGSVQEQKEDMVDNHHLQALHHLMSVVVEIDDDSKETLGSHEDDPSKWMRDVIAVVGLEKGLKSELERR